MADESETSGVTEAQKLSEKERLELEHAHDERLHQQRLRAERSNSRTTALISVIAVVATVLGTTLNTWNQSRLAQQETLNERRERYFEEIQDLHSNFLSFSSGLQNELLKLERHADDVRIAAILKGKNGSILVDWSYAWQAFYEYAERSNTKQYHARLWIFIELLDAYLEYLQIIQNNFATSLVSSEISVLLKVNYATIKGELIKLRSLIRQQKPLIEEELDVTLINVQGKIRSSSEELTRKIYEEFPDFR